MSSTLEDHRIYLGTHPTPHGPKNHRQGALADCSTGSAATAALRLVKVVGPRPFNVRI